MEQLNKDQIIFAFFKNNINCNIKKKWTIYVYEEVRVREENLGILSRVSKRKDGTIILFFNQEKHERKLSLVGHYIFVDITPLGLAIYKTNARYKEEEMIVETRWIHKYEFILEVKI